MLYQVKLLSVETYVLVWDWFKLREILDKCILHTMTLSLNSDIK